MFRTLHDFGRLTKAQLTMTSVTQLFSEGWEPMETAPLDGTPIQVCRGELRATVSWSRSINAWVIGLATEPNQCEGYCCGSP